MRTLNKKIALATMLAAAPLWAAAEQIGARQPTAVPYFASNCFNCHGTEGRAESAIPVLAGREKAYLAEALKGFKDGSRQSTIMHQLAKGYTDEELALLADYFAQQKK